MLGFQLRGAATGYQLEAVREDLKVELATGALLQPPADDAALQQAFLLQRDVATSRLRRREWLDETDQKALLSMSKRFKSAIALHCSCPQKPFFFSSYMHSCGFYVRALFQFQELQIQRIESMMMRVVLRLLRWHGKDAVVWLIHLQSHQTDAQALSAKNCRTTTHPAAR